jgi:hypothetical protein
VNLGCFGVTFSPVIEKFSFFFVIYSLIPAMPTRGRGDIKKVKFVFRLTLTFTAPIMPRVAVRLSLLFQGYEGYPLSPNVVRAVEPKIR